MSHSNSPPARSTSEWLARTVQDVVVSVIAAAVVSALSLYYFEIRLENSKDRVTTLLASEERFDAAHNDVVVEFGLYSNELFTHNDSKQKAKFLQSVITTQLELLDLRQHMGDQDIPALSVYGDELARLRNLVGPVKTQDDLGPALRSVQQLLAAHEKITKAVESKSQIHFFD